MATRLNPGTNRREFCKSAAAGVVGTLAIPYVSTSAKTDSARPVIGVDGQQFEVDHNWAKLPEQYQWQTTHNVAIGSDGMVYVIHEGRYDETDHPSIFVFDGDGRFVRAFGKQFQGGGHGLEVRNEGGEDFLYVCAYKQQRSIAKLSQTGDEMWRQGAPMESGFYHEGEDQFPRSQDDNPWGRNRFLPTNIAFHPDGGFVLADGYGSYRIHRYNQRAQWTSSFGGPSDAKQADGTFNLPHGIWIDTRGDTPLIVVADRANGRLQWFTFQGKHQQTLDGFLLPANIDVHGELLLVPDLVGRVTILGRDNQIIAHLGDDSARMQADSEYKIRSDESKWLPGKFVHPHDACFDTDGNIYVTEWVQSGRVTKLTRMS